MVPRQELQIDQVVVAKEMVVEVVAEEVVAKDVVVKVVGALPNCRRKAHPM